MQQRLELSSLLSRNSQLRNENVHLLRLLESRFNGNATGGGLAGCKARAVTRGLAPDSSMPLQPSTISSFPTQQATLPANQISVTVQQPSQPVQVPVGRPDKLLRPKKDFEQPQRLQQASVPLVSPLPNVAYPGSNSINPMNGPTSVIEIHNAQANQCAAPQENARVSVPNAACPLTSHRFDSVPASATCAAAQGAREYTASEMVDGLIPSPAKTAPTGECDLSMVVSSPNAAAENASPKTHIAPADAVMRPEEYNADAAQTEHPISSLQDLSSCSSPIGSHGNDRAIASKAPESDPLHCESAHVEAMLQSRTSAEDLHVPSI